MTHLIKLELKKFGIAQNIIFMFAAILFSILFITISLWDSMTDPKLSKGESLDSDMNVQEPVNVIYQTIISVKSLCFSSIVISTDALAYIILGHEEKNTMTFLSD